MYDMTVRISESALAPANHVGEATKSMSMLAHIIRSAITPNTMLKIKYIFSGFVANRTMKSIAVARAPTWKEAFFFSRISFIEYNNDIVDANSKGRISVMTL